MLQTNFTTPLNSIAGVYPQSLEEEVAKLAVPADQDKARADYRDKIDYVHDSAEGDILNDRAAWKRFQSAVDAQSMRSMIDDRVTAKIRQLGIPAVTLNTQSNITDKVLESVWDTWRGEGGAQK